MTIDTRSFEDDPDVENPRALVRLLGIITGETPVGPLRDTKDGTGIAVPDTVGVWDSRRESYVTVSISDLTPREAYAFAKVESNAVNHNKV